jgi:hypothetical protein
MTYICIPLCDFGKKKALVGLVVVVVVALVVVVVVVAVVALVLWSLL